MHSTDAKLLRGATTCVANITQNIDTVPSQILRKLDVIENLVNILKNSNYSEDVPIQKAVTTALANLTGSEKNLEIFLKIQGSVPLIINLGKRSTETQIIFSCVSIINNSSLKGKDILITKGAIFLLENIIEYSRDQDILREAKQALKVLTSGTFIILKIKNFLLLFYKKIVDTSESNSSPSRSMSIEDLREIMNEIQKNDNAVKQLSQLSEDGKIKLFLKEKF